MQCLNCGLENKYLLCSNCRNEMILDKVFNDIRKYKPESCENVFLCNYTSNLSPNFDIRDVIPELLSLFEETISDYYYCRYKRIIKSEDYEISSSKYLKTHNWEDIKSQTVLYELIQFVYRDDYNKPRNSCLWISNTENLSPDLYLIAAEYFSMVGDYDISDVLIDKALKRINDINCDAYIYHSREGIAVCCEKQLEKNNRYKNGKPFWPTTEIRRKALAKIYDEKGISYPRIELKPEKIPEDKFKDIKECTNDEINDYCAFWCEEAKGSSTIKCIYQIAAVKIRNGSVEDEFQSYVRPWDGIAWRRNAAKNAGISLKVIDEFEAVDLVMKKFYSFVGNDALISTGGLGTQASLISRASRYSGMNEINNEFLDILDFAADVNDDFDFTNNTREYLLNFFELEEGHSALDKAKLNYNLYEKLKDFSEE